MWGMCVFANQTKFLKPYVRTRLLIEFVSFVRLITIIVKE